MNHSMLTCGRTTHLKIVAFALIAAVLFATVGLQARLDDSGAGNVTASVKAGGPAMKAGSGAWRAKSPRITIGKTPYQ